MLAAISARINILDKKEKYYFNQSYMPILRKNHIHTILIHDLNAIDTIIDLCDFLILVGGEDIHPFFYHDSTYSESYKENDFLDYILMKKFIEHNKPILGICRGMQFINVFFHGNLINIKNHNHHTHSLVFPKNSKCKHYYKNKYVNSYHHQAIMQLGKHLKIEAISEDGIIEIISYKNILGVQFHPELLEDNATFSYFLENYINNEIRNKKP